MNRIVTFGIGGWCEYCDESHDHPLHNIVEIVELSGDDTIEFLDVASSQELGDES